MLELSRVDKMRRTAFLGREFLAWLMFRSLRDEGIFRVDGDAVELFFDKALRLEGAGSSRENVAVKADAPQDTSEVAAALRNGKVITRATLQILTDGQEFGLTLDAATLAFKSVKLPKSEELDPADVIQADQDARAVLESVVHGLFAQFLGIRIDAELWAVESDAIRDWIDGLDANAAITVPQATKARDSAPVDLNAFVGSATHPEEASVHECRGDCGKECNDCGDGCPGCTPVPAVADESNAEPVQVLARDGKIGARYVTPAGHVVRLARIMGDRVFVLTAEGREVPIQGSHPLTVFVG